MKNKKVIALAAAMVLGLATLSYGGYVTGFRVVAMADGQVTIQKGKAEPIQVAAGDKKFAVGDKVSFDVKNRKVRPEPEGC